MQRQDFWYNAEAKSMGITPTGTKAGQFLFLSTQTSVNMDTGQIIRDLIDLEPEARSKLATSNHGINGWYGSIMAQTWTIYQNLAKILVKQGTSLENIIRQRIFLRDIETVDWMERVMLPFFPKEKPVTLILGVPDRGLHQDIRVWVDAIAFLPQEGGLQKQAIYLPELEKVTKPYPQAVKVGQLLFIDGITGLDPKTGKPVSSFDELGSEVRSELDGLYIDAASEAMKCQWWLTYDGHIKRLLESQGAKISDLLDVTGFWRHGMKDSGKREYLRERLFKTPEDSPPSTAFGISNISVIPDVEVITGAVALLPGEYRKQALRSSEAERGASYAALTKGGPFWFHAGQPGLDFAKQQHINSFADLTGSGQLLAQGQIDNNQITMSQAWHIYHFILDNVETKADQVVHQTVYMDDPSDWPAVEKIANIVFKGRIPPTTVLPVDSIGFYWQYSTPTPQSNKLEIQLWGYKG